MIFLILLNYFDSQAAPMINSQTDDYAIAKYVLECAHSMTIVIFFEPKDLCVVNYKTKLLFTAQICSKTTKVTIPKYTPNMRYRWMEFSQESTEGIDVFDIVESTQFDESKIPPRPKFRNDREEAVASLYSHEYVDTVAFKSPKAKAKVANLTLMPTNPHKLFDATLIIAEAIAFSAFINIHIGDRRLVARHMPLQLDAVDLFQKIGDGLILCALIDFISPRALEIDALHCGYILTAEQKIENIRRALGAAYALNCSTHNITPLDIFKGRYSMSCCMALYHLM
jgi:hypothetical protein